MGADAYLQARAAFERANGAVTEIVNRVQKVANALRDSRPLFTFSNVEGSGFPPEVIMSRSSISEDGNAWPSAKSINLALMEWHKAKTAVDMAWSAIPPDQRNGLVAPPWGR
jgi:hypothetical protein